LNKGQRRGNYKKRKEKKEVTIIACDLGASTGEAEMVGFGGGKGKKERKKNRLPQGQVKKRFGKNLKDEGDDHCTRWAAGSNAGKGETLPDILNRGGIVGCDIDDRGSY